MSTTEIAVRPNQDALTGHGNGDAIQQFLTFRLGAEEYGIDILRVQEIRSYEPPTRVAGAPEHMKGIVNLRGAIVPIIDLRICLGSPAEYTPFTVVVILNIRHRITGIVVDSVSDVLELRDGDIKEAPTVSSSMDTRFITGICKVAERMLILLDIDGLISSEQMELS